MKHAILLLCGLCLLGTAHGETRYVTDRLKITMRSGESTSHKILRMLPSGTPVKVLGTNRDSGYSLVQTSSGEGYVLTRQLMDEPSARDQLASMRARLDELQEAPGKLSSRLTSLQREHDALRSAHEELTQIKRQLEQELEGIRRTAANAVRIANERTELRKTVAALTRQVEDLKQENRDLGNQTAQNWFMIGAGVVVAGIILGLILPHLRFQRRKSSWGSL